MAANETTCPPGFLSCLRMWSHQAGYILTLKHRPRCKNTNPTWQRRRFRLRFRPIKRVRVKMRFGGSVQLARLPVPVGGANGKFGTHFSVVSGYCYGWFGFNQREAALVSP